MISPQTFLRQPTSFKKKFKLYPPSINEVLGDENFGFYHKILTTSQEEIEDEYQEKKIEGIPLTPYEYLMASVYSNKQFDYLTKKAFYFFLHEPVTILPEQKKIIIGDLTTEIKKVNSVSDLRVLEENEFFDFQNCIRILLGEKAIEPPDPDEDPIVKKVKAKARLREKVKTKQGKGLKLVSSLTAICCMGIGLTPLNIGEISYAAVGTIMQTYQEKDKYETDIKSLLAGADSKKVKPKYWIRNIDD